MTADNVCLLYRHTWLADWGPSDLAVSLLPDPFRAEVARIKVDKIIRALAEEAGRTPVALDPTTPLGQASSRALRCGSLGYHFMGAGKQGTTVWVTLCESVIILRPRTSPIAPLACAA